MIVKERDKNPVSILIALALLIVLIIALVIGLKGNIKADGETKTIMCTFEGYDDEVEEDNTIKIVTKNDKLSYLSFDRKYTYTENEVLLQYKYDDENYQIKELSKLGSETTISKNSEYGEIKIIININYDKIKTSNSTTLTEPYSIFVRNNLSYAELYNYLVDYGYTCE